MYSNFLRWVGGPKFTFVQANSFGEVALALCS
jgi:hypothetical protein